MQKKKIPLRKCTGCGEMKPKKELVRVVKTPEDEVLIDLTGRVNGRGAYICPNADCLKIARKAKRTGESFVGGINDENAREIPLSFDFLDKGKKYEATIYADGKDAHYLDNPHSYTVTKKTVTAKSKMTLRLAQGGGVAISIKEIK